MISYTARTIKIGEEAKAISSFEVWFTSPFGLHKTLEEAIQVCVTRQIDPELNVRAIAVAITADGGYELC